MVLILDNIITLIRQIKTNSTTSTKNLQCDSSLSSLSQHRCVAFCTTQQITWSGRGSFMRPNTGLLPKQLFHLYCISLCFMGWTFCEIAISGTRDIVQRYKRQWYCWLSQHWSDLHNVHTKTKNLTHFSLNFINVNYSLYNKKYLTMEMMYIQMVHSKLTPWPSPQQQS